MKIVKLNATTSRQLLKKSRRCNIKFQCIPLDQIHFDAHSKK